MKKRVFIFITVIAVSTASAWEKYAGNPVLEPGPDWAYLALSDPSVICILIDLTPARNNIP